ncbi:Uncharacterized protein C7orf31 [Trichoplax sp. H2]|nr:Uncharacterized protein C7orf31 [Trichoplax sp. H2]|eukprot:RDD45668.1 Uncharacterized protein C7orf31 [Trichoplax sp. H2]
MDYTANRMRELYKETIAVPVLSPTYQSNQIFTPLQSPQRETVSESQYRTYYEKWGRATKTPWGRHHSYAGIGPLFLPPGHRPKEEPPTRVEKGHKHYGSGIIPFPTTPVQQNYCRTGSQLSRLRKTDELVPKPLTADLVNIQVKHPLPREHPYASHISKLSIFPSPVSPDEANGRLAVASTPYGGPPPVPSTIATQPSEQIIRGKTKGSPWRHEIVQNGEHPLHRKALTWHGESVYQIYSGPNTPVRQQIYPAPPKSIAPNPRPRDGNLAISPRTADTLIDVRKSLMTTTYQSKYSSHVPNVLKIHRKGDVTTETANRMKKNRGQLFIGNFYSEVYVSDNEDEDANKTDDDMSQAASPVSTGNKNSSICKDQGNSREVKFENDDDNSDEYKRSPRVVKISDKVTIVNEDNSSKTAIINSSNTVQKSPDISSHLRERPTADDSRPGFSKSDMHRRFNQTYSEISPDLRENSRSGKRQIIHGCPTYYFH